MYGLYTWTNIMAVEENDEAFMVELYAQQFNWKARYAGARWCVLEMLTFVSSRF